MKNNEKYKRTFMEVMENAADLFLLSVLWILCCIPLVTISTSTAALYFAVVKSIRKKYGHPICEFWSYFKSNWKQGIGLSLLYDVVFFALAAQSIGIYHMPLKTEIINLYNVVNIWAWLLFLAMTIYLFPVFSRFVYGTFETMKVAIIMAIRHLFSTLIMGAFIVLCGFASFKCFALVFILPAVTMLVISYRMEGIFRKYMEKPEDTDKIPWYWE